MRTRVQALARPFRHSHVRFVGGPAITRFVNLTPGDSFSRARLRNTVVNGLRGFLLRLNGNFSFITQRGLVHARGGSCFVSLIFCGCVLGSFILVSLGAAAVARRSIKRVSVCIQVCSRHMHNRNSGPAVNVILYSRASRSVTHCSILRSGSHLFTSGCVLCVPARGRLQRRVTQRGRFFHLRRSRSPGRRV